MTLDVGDGGGGDGDEAPVGAILAAGSGDAGVGPAAATILAGGEDAGVGAWGVIIGGGEDAVCAEGGFIDRGGNGMLMEVTVTGGWRMTGSSLAVRQTTASASTRTARCCMSRTPTSAHARSSGSGPSRRVRASSTMDRRVACARMTAWVTALASVSSRSTNCRKASVSGSDGTGTVAS